MTEQIYANYNREFMQKFFHMTLDFLEKTLSGTNQVINFTDPSKLKQQIDFTIKQQPTDPLQLIASCKQVMEKQTKPYHPGFHNQLFGGLDSYSIMGNIMTTCMNGTMFTYEVAPCYTLMENQIYEELRKRIGGWDKIDGMMTPGGSFSNWNSLLLARYKRFPESKRKGIQGLPIMKLFTSEQSHYSIDKGAILEGYGIQNIVKVRCNPKGEMIVEDLELQIKLCIQKGQIPLYVNATAGTSVAGCIDPVTQIAEICKKYNVWCHVDAALGGAFWMSEKLKERLGKYDNVDSITWDPHKALVVPLQATFFLTRHVGLMEQSNSMKADYLFPKERNSYDISLDTGDKSLQCGRVIDILKVWVYFKGNGWKQIARHIQAQHQLALYQQSIILKDSQKWILVYATATINLSFYYIPSSMRNHERNHEFYAKLSKITIQAKKYMIDEGKILIGYATNGTDNNYFWRNVQSNPFITKKHVETELELIEYYCERAAKTIFH